MKLVTRGFGDNVNCYQDADLEKPEFKAAVEMATKLWRQKIAEKEAADGDRGACVMGAGIHVHYLGKGKRKPGSICIIDPQQLGRTQGESAWSGSAKDVVAYLKKYGIHSWFECGRMD